MIAVLHWSIDIIGMFCLGLLVTAEILFFMWMAEPEKFEKALRRKPTKEEIQAANDRAKLAEEWRELFKRQYHQDDEPR